MTAFYYCVLNEWRLQALVMFHHLSRSEYYSRMEHNRISGQHQSLPPGGSVPLVTQ
jgi:hypothetical protein